MKSFINKLRAIWGIIRAKHFHVACSDMEMNKGEISVSCYYYASIEFLQIASQAADDNASSLIEEDIAVNAAYNIINNN